MIAAPETLETNALAKKISQCLDLTRAERERLGAFESTGVQVAAGIDVLEEQQPDDKAAVFIEGRCYRFKLLADGRRQVVDFILPGSIFALEANLFETADHLVGTLTPCTIKPCRARPVVA